MEEKEECQTRDGTKRALEGEGRACQLEPARAERSAADRGAGPPRPLRKPPTRQARRLPISHLPTIVDQAATRAWLDAPLSSPSEAAKLDWFPRFVGKCWVTGWSARCVCGGPSSCRPPSLGMPLSRPPARLVSYICLPAQRAPHAHAPSPARPATKTQRCGVRPRVITPQATRGSPTSPRPAQPSSPLQLNHPVSLASSCASPSRSGCELPFAASAGGRGAGRARAAWGLAKQARRRAWPWPRSRCRPSPVPRLDARARARRHRPLAWGSRGTCEHTSQAGGGCAHFFRRWQNELGSQGPRLWRSPYAVQ